MQPLHTGRASPGISHSHQRLGLFTILRADVDPHALDLGCLFPLLGVHQMNRLAANDAGNRTVLAHDPDPIARQRGCIKPADAVEVEKPVIVDVLDLEADLVDMCIEHHSWRAGRVEDRYCIP